MYIYIYRERYMYVYIYIYIYIERERGILEGLTQAEAVVVSYSGICNWLYAVGFTGNYEIYTFVIV